MAGNSRNIHRGAVQSSKRCKRYAYNVLHLPNTIRILRLEPGKKADEIRGRLYETNLNTNEGKPAEFEALSYAWGVPDYNHVLYTPDGVIKISTNLAAALRRTRLEERSRHVWADAVCIDQKDLVEPSGQVKLMGQIYSNAKRVLIWLGPDRHDRAKAIFHMIRKSHRIRSTHDLKAIRNGLAELLRCKWFSRLWVVQEYHLAQSAFCMWGDAGINYKQLEEPLRAIVREENSYSPWITLKRGGVITVSDALTSTRGLRCADERDRVFATLSLPYDDESDLVARIRQIRPNYALSAGRAMFEYARAFVDCSCTYLLIAQVCHGPSVSTHSQEPSWLPNLRKPSPGGFLPLSVIFRDNNIPKNLAQDPVDIAQRILLLTGWYRTSPIDIIGPPMDPALGGSRLEDIATFWRHHIHPQQYDMDEYQYRQQERLFTQVLICHSWDITLLVHWKSLHLAITRRSGSAGSSDVSANARKMLRLLKEKRSVESRV